VACLKNGFAGGITSGNVYPTGIRMTGMIGGVFVSVKVHSASGNSWSRPCLPFRKLPSVI